MVKAVDCKSTGETRVGSIPTALTQCAAYLVTSLVLVIIFFGGMV